mmetsp:Transcript_15618/g.32573  ORF Transcript_15618/g.32573 Transcript_15618/m.32573 type:complete len:270 (-) Transcript_15618:164-973(-)
MSEFTRRLPDPCSYDRSISSFASFSSSSSGSSSGARSPGLFASPSASSAAITSAESSFASMCIPEDDFVLPEASFINPVVPSVGEGDLVGLVGLVLLTAPSASLAAATSPSVLPKGLVVAALWSSADIVRPPSPSSRLGEEAGDISRLERALLNLLPFDPVSSLFAGLTAAASPLLRLLFRMRAVSSLLTGVFLRIVSLGLTPPLFSLSSEVPICAIFIAITSKLYARVLYRDTHSASSGASLISSSSTLVLTSLSSLCSVASCRFQQV